MSGGRVNIQGVSPDAVHFKQEQTAEIQALLNERFKESYFKVKIERIKDKDWFVLRRADLSTADDYIQPIIPVEMATSVAFLETGLAIQLPYGFYPVMEDSGVRLVKYAVGEGQQLYIYVPYDTHGGWLDRYAMIVGDYESSKKTRTRDGDSYKIGAIRDDRRQKVGSGAADNSFYLLYPPSFDYAKTFIEIPDHSNLKWPDMRTNEQDVYVIIDDSGSTAGTGVELKVRNLFGEANNSSFVWTLLNSKKNRVHVHYARTGKEDVFEVKMPEEEDPLQAIGQLDVLKGSIIRSLMEFYRPAGEDENIPIAVSRCLASSGRNEKLGANERPNIFLMTDEESEVPDEWAGYMGRRTVERRPADSSNIVLGTKLNIPLLLAEQLFDAPVAEPSPDVTKQNELIVAIQKELTGEVRAQAPTPDECAGMAKKAHEEAYGEELFRIGLSHLALVAQEDIGEYTDWLISVIRSDDFDYPVKKRAIFLLGLYSHRGKTEIIDVLLTLRSELKDKRLRMDISKALSFTPNIERAKAILKIAELDPNGVDMEEVTACGLNEYTVKILSIVIRDGLIDSKKAAIKVIEALMITSADIKGLQDALGKNYNKFIALYWRPEYIDELRSALIDIEILYGAETAELIQKLSGISLLIAPKAKWEERDSFVLNRLNTTHYYVKAPYGEGIQRLRALRETAETEESFLFVKDPSEQTFYETGDGETMGSASPLPPETMKGIINGEPDEIEEMHLHPGIYKGEMGLHDIASDADILTSVINSALYQDIYDDVSYTHRIMTPNGIFTIRPNDMSAGKLQELFNGPAPKILDITNACNEYFIKTVKEGGVIDIGVIKKILEPIVEVEFVLWEK